MQQSKAWFLFALCLAFISLVSFDDINAGFAENYPSALKHGKHTRQKNRLSWQQIWDSLKQKKVAGVTRDFEGFCLVSPAPLEDKTLQENSSINNTSLSEIWHQKPIFLFKSGKIQKIALKNDRGFYWEQEIQPSQTHLFYDGKPLELGETYILKVFHPFETELYDIKVVSSVRYQQIEQELEQIAAQATYNKLNGSTETTLNRVNYFLRQKMWSDVFWEIYHSSNSIRDNINIDSFCDSATTNFS